MSKDGGGRVEHRSEGGHESGHHDSQHATLEVYGVTENPDKNNVKQS